MNLEFFQVPTDIPGCSRSKTGAVTHHLADHSYPGFHGRDNIRWFEFQGDNRVVLIPTEDGKGGMIARNDATYKLAWERIR